MNMLHFENLKGEWLAVGTFVDQTDSNLDRF